LKILICEDEVLIALALEDLVLELGHDVVGRVRSAEGARTTAEGETPDIALVDLGLADGWTGPELVKEFSAAGIGCIVISGQTEDFEGRSNAVGMLAKPVNERELAALLTGRSDET